MACAVRGLHWVVGCSSEWYQYSLQGSLQWRQGGLFCSQSLTTLPILTTNKPFVSFCCDTWRFEICSLQSFMPMKDKDINIYAFRLHMIFVNNCKYNTRNCDVFMTMTTTTTTATSTTTTIAATPQTLQKPLRHSGQLRAWRLKYPKVSFFNLIIQLAEFTSHCATPGSVARDGHASRYGARLVRDTVWCKAWRLWWRLWATCPVAGASPEEASRSTGTSDRIPGEEQVRGCEYPSEPPKHAESEPSVVEYLELGQTAWAGADDLSNSYCRMVGKEPACSHPFRERSRSKSGANVFNFPYTFGTGSRSQ